LLSGSPENLSQRSWPTLLSTTSSLF
jgi:hypothetical protein